MADRTRADGDRILLPTRCRARPNCRDLAEISWVADDYPPDTRASTLRRVICTGFDRLKFRQCSLNSKGWRFRHGTSRVIGRVLSAIAISVWVPSIAGAQNYCPAANPNDSVADDLALQACLNGGGLILLSAGSPGYILQDGLRLRTHGTVLSSVDTNNRATIVAASSLFGVMLLVEANNFEISFLVFDGNRFNRTSTCSYPNGSNLLLYGDNFVVRFTDSNFARCGSALEVAGSGFQIYNNTMAHNGWSADEANGEWADGITIHRCQSGSVYNNQFAENTDIGIVVNEGPGCQIRFNTIWNYDRYAFAGMHISAGSAGGNHGSALYSDNQISSGFDKMSFGLIVGAEQWHGTRTANVGEVSWNYLAGAVINLAVDGVDGGAVVSNVPSGAQGTRGYGLCLGQSADNFIAAHNGTGLTLQPGWVSRSCH